MNCKACDGNGQVCDDCHHAMSSSKVCPLCEGEFCSPVFGAGFDCLTGHKCQALDKALVIARSFKVFPMACPNCRGTVAVEVIDAAAAVVVIAGERPSVLSPERHACGYRLREDAEFVEDARDEAFERLTARLALSVQQLAAIGGARREKAESS